MNEKDMRIASPETDLVANEGAILEELLPLQGAKVLELGCGKAEKTRIAAQRAMSVLALEVDKIQLTKNRKIKDMPNVIFGHGGAEKIPALNSDFDIVLMFKSLHHVPVGQMDSAFAEIRRVLKPGGLAYISEPVYAGDFNEILRLFNDERQVREAAFAAVKRAVASRRLIPVTQKFFLSPMHFDDFEQFQDQVLNVTHTDNQLSPSLMEEVRSRFNRHMTDKGAEFHMPIRVDLLRKTVY